MTRNTGKVAIVGSGPAGLAAARAFLLNSDFTVFLYDRNPEVGGVWYYPPEAQRRTTAMYDELETNLCKDIMQFSGFPFDESVSTFPSRVQVQDYLEKYYQTFIEGQSRVSVKLGCNVDRVEKIDGHWLVQSGGQVQEVDFVVVANGHFDVPYVPSNILGLEQWIAHDANSVLHSKNYDSCELYRDKNVVVVGNGSSGSDIANQVSSVAKHVYHSVPDVGKTQWNENPVVTAVPVISNLDYANSKSVTFEDGKVVGDIDSIIWATGFFYDIPFLETYRDKVLGDDGSRRPTERLYNLWKQIVFTEDPTLAFSLLCKNVVPFPLAELQAAVLVKVFTGEVEVPPSEATASAFAPSLASVAPKDFHSLITPRDIEYYRELQAILDAHGGTEDPLQPVRWDDQMAALRYETAILKQERTKKLVERAIKLRQQGKAYYLE